ncbi:GGDEF domain-containing protein [Aquitalea magnusonii]|uniref:diguanylate cyclase n=2 Tax=Aquitalea magnusonii TaxID=332411 RepID=A0A318JD19_9NEIS|nr:GGDEF domain-containing protein [Aquitalea magnusonii]PXX41698.1 toxin CptA [Aquitalea magnusonii]
MKPVLPLLQEQAGWREEADLVRYFIDIAYRSILAVICGLPVLVTIIYQHAQPLHLALWLLLFGLVEWRLWWVIRRFRAADLHPGSVFQHYTAVRDCLLANCLLWGASIWVMDSHQLDDPYHLLLLLWLTGIFALLCIMMAACRDIHALFFATFWAYPLCSLLVHGQRLELMILAGLLLYLVAQWRFLGRFHRTLFDTVKLRHANQSMMENLVELHVQAAVKRERLQQQQRELTEAIAERQRLLECDALTGCYNQRALRRQLDAHAAASAASGREWALAMLDLDHFKQVNDSFGHQAGDAVLQQLVQQLSSLLPPGLELFRYGGEEFVILAAGLAEAELAAALDDIRHTLAAARWEALPASWQQTVSAGVVACQPGDPVNHSLQLADMALYAAKHQGRNRVCLASALATPPLERFSRSG